jgi:uncharacterized small protein (DUF1192 family)
MRRERFFDCIRCEFAKPMRGSNLCHSCNDVISKRIARWLDGDREDTNQEMAREFFLSVNGLKTRIQKLRKERERQCAESSTLNAMNG